MERTSRNFEIGAVLNPGCLEKDGVVHMFYRAIGVKGRSTIGYCRLKNNEVIERFANPVIVPEYEYEKGGVEDPRIVSLDGDYYMFYTAYDGKNSRVAYAVSKDLEKFEKKGLITPSITYDEAEDIFRQSRVREKYRLFESHFKEVVGQDVLLWEKDAYLFPKKFNNKFALLHRILPGIQVIYFSDFNRLTDQYWRDYLKHLNRYVVLDPEYRFESRNIGGGCPPIETQEGWLLIYHAVEDSDEGKVYHAAAALLDLEDPTKVLGRLPYPLFSPQEIWEVNIGFSHVGQDIKGVVFPTGALIRDERLYIYYGAADRLVACKSVDLAQLLGELKNSRLQMA